MKIQAFLDNARLLSDEFGITPLLYGSLGLEFLTGLSLNADDVDILIPKEFVTRRWSELKALLQNNGYMLTDEHEHAFAKDGVCYAYAQIEELESFAGIAQKDIGTRSVGSVRFMLLSLSQYLKVYTASAKDGYRIEIREKKDAEKIALINRLLSGSI